MPITTTAPYKSGTLSSIGTGANGVNTRLNTSGISWAAGDVGRHVYFYSGNAKWESREIIAQGTNYCDILFPFGEYPVLKPDGTEVPSDTPSSGNSLGVSYKLDDLDDGSTLIKESVNFYRHTTSNAWTIGQNVMIHDTNKTLEFNSEWTDLDGIMQFGNLDSDGFVRDSCCLMDNSTGFGGFSLVGNNVSAADDFGSFRLFGGTFLITGTSQFLRMYRNSGTSEAVQIQAVNFNGPAGGRVDGTKSYFLDPIYSNLSSSIGPINPKSNVAMIKGIRVNSGAQVVYHFWSVSKSITVPGIRFNPNGITDRFARLNSNSSGHTLTLDDILVGDIQTLQDNGITIFDQQSSLSGSNIVKITNPLTVKTQNNASGMRLRIKNTNGTEVFDENSDGNGDWAKTSYEWGRVTISALTTYDLDNAVIVAPYTCNTRKYDKITQSFSFDARSPLSTVIPDVADSSITETTKATVLAYGTLETLDKFRDRHKAEHVDNDDVEDISAGGGAVDLAASTDIEASYTGYALIIDATASQAWSRTAGTVTIKAADLAPGANYTNLIPFNSLVFSNGATASCDVTFNSGKSAVCANESVITGNVNINSGGTLTYTDLTNIQIKGNGASGGLLRISGATTSTTLDLRSYTINSGFEVENDSGEDITLTLNASQTVPTLTETNGTIAVDSSAPLTVNNLTSAYIYLEDNLGAQQDYQTLVTGTYNFGIPATATGTWKLVIDRQGFDRKSFTFTADGNAKEFDGILTQQVDLAGGAIYQAQSSSDVNIVGASSKIDVQNSTIAGSIIYDMVQDYAVSAAGMADDTVDALSYFPTDNGNYFSLATWQFRRNASAVSLPTVNAIVSQNSDDPVDETNGQVSVQFSGGGLTATAKQDVRDSMALDLSPTVTAVSGSIDTTLNNTSVHSRTSAAIRPSL